jgi:predicted transcriptional regulator
MQTRVFTSHVPLPLAKQIDALAEQLERPRGWVIKQALQQWVDMETLKHEYIQQGLADVKAGRVTTHAEMGEWIRSMRKKKKRV